MEKKKRERIAGLDVLRALAIVLVMVSHFINYRADRLLQSGLRSPSWTLAVMIRYIVLINVPLFLLLTGYLLQSRKPDRRHAAAVIPVMLSWFALSCLISVAEIPLFGMGEGGIARKILYLFDFRFGYTWYVEMYLCLYLILPFFNILLDHLTQKQQLWLIGSLAALTMLPGVGKSFIVTGIYFDFFPDQFEGIYCITYYLIGAYIARHKPRPHPGLCAASVIAVLALETALNYYYSSTEYAWWLFYQYSSLTHAIIATSLLLLFYRIQSLPRVISIPLREISVCSFEMYLVSYLTDRIFYENSAMLITVPWLTRLTSHAMWLTGLCNFLTAYLIARIARLALVPIADRLRRLAAGRAAAPAPAVQSIRSEKDPVLK